MTQGFYKTEDSMLHHAPNFIVFPDGTEMYTIHKDSYTYPVNDWYYFDSEEEAKTFFGIE